MRDIPAYPWCLPVVLKVADVAPCSAAEQGSED
jgi:hypothetical protein